MCANRQFVLDVKVIAKARTSRSRRERPRMEQNRHVFDAILRSTREQIACRIVRWTS